MSSAGGRDGETAATGERSVAVGGDVVESLIVTGDDAEIKLGFGAPVGVLLAVLGLRRRPRKKARRTPLVRRPSPYADRIDREGEIAAVVAGTGAVNLFGPAGVGKTYVLAAALGRDEALGLPDGVVYLYAKGKSRTDLLQALFEEFYECRPPFKASEAVIRRDLEGKRAVVVLDSLELERDDLQQLCQDVPGCRFVIGSRTQTLWSGEGIALGGLELADAFDLVQRELGRPLNESERKAGTQICIVLQGHPLQIRQALAIVEMDGWSLEQVADGLPAIDASEALIRLALDRLSGDQRRILDSLAAFRGLAVGEEHVGALAEVADPSADLGALERRRLVDSHSPRYSIADNFLESERFAGAANDVVDRALEYFSGWLARTHANLSAQLSEAEPLLELMRTAVATGRRSRAIELGRAIDDAFAFGRRFGASREVHELVLDAARRTEDRAAEAWALHQRGSHRVALHGPDAGASDLQEAARIRRELGDLEGAQASTSNIAVAERAAIPPQGLARFARWFLRLPLLVAVGVVAALVAGSVGTALGVWSAAGDGGGPTPPVPASLLIVEKAGSGEGSVTSESGVDCGTECTVDYEAGTAVTLRAVPGGGSRFAGWSGSGCTGAGACTVTVRGKTKVTATFLPLATAALSVRLTGDGAGTVTSVPDGIVCGSGCSAPFARGELVTLTAKARAGSVFAGWSGDCSGVNRCRLKMTDARSVTAAFEAGPADALHVIAAGDGSGTVVSRPSGIRCPGICSASFPEGEQVTLVATEAAGSAFASWSREECGTERECRVTIAPGLAPLTATFDAVPQQTLQIVLEGGGKGTVTSRPAGIDCGLDCIASFDQGKTVSLIPVADPSSLFDGWKARHGWCREPTTCDVALTAPEKIYAFFVPAYAVSVSTRGEGKILSDPAGIDCTSCEGRFPADRLVYLTARPGPGWDFDYWLGDCKRQPETCRLTVTRAMSATAVFREQPTNAGASS